MSDLYESLNSTLLDPEQIQMLIDAGASESAELFEELLEMFETESSDKVSELKSCAETGDHDQLGRAAHALAGSSANVGGKTVWQLAKQMENSCKSGNPGEAIRILPELEQTHRQTLLDLRAVLVELKSRPA